MTEKPARPPAPGDAPWPQRRTSLAAHLLLLIGAAAAVFLAGRTSPGRLGAFLMAAGLALVIFPPRVRVDRKLWAVGAGLVLSVGLAVLPQSWFPAPGWRQSLIAAGVSLPASVTPMPDVTCFWLAVSAMAALVGLFGLAHPLRSREQLALAVVGVATCGAYASLAIYVKLSGWEFPLDPDPRVFGFFWNINHASTFLVTGCLLALAILGVAYRGRHWFAGSVAAAGLAVCAAALFFFTTSRGGIISLLIGALLWFFGMGAANRSKPLLVSFAALFLGSLLLFLASESMARQRLLDLVGIAETRGISTKPVAKATEEAGLLRDGRLLIYADTLRIVRDYPLTGTGLGTFQSVFPLYRERSLADPVVLHPESDWLMMAAEAGLPAVVLLGVGIGMLIRRVWPLRDHPYWPLRWGILCAGLAALLHGFVDVPAHGPPLGTWILVICGIGFQVRPRDSTARPSRLQHGLFVVAGLGAFALGLPLLRAGWFGGNFWPPDAAQSALAKVDVLQAEGKLKESVEVGREALRRAPLEGALYTQLGGALLELRAGDAEVEAMFRAGRLVNPAVPGVPMEQGLLWIDIDPSKTAALWQEALRRREHFDRQRRSGNQGDLFLYAILLRLAAEYPGLQLQLLVANADRSDFVLIWLERAAPALVAVEIPRLASDPAFLSRLAEPGRRRFLQAWHDKGDREGLFRFIADRPDWEGAAWPIQVRRLIDARKFKEATQVVARRYQIDLELPPPGSGDSEARVGDATSVVEAFQTAWHKGNTVAARRILEEARAERSSPSVIWRLSASVSAFEEQWPAAWQYLERYLRESGLGAFP